MDNNSSWFDMVNIIICIIYHCTGRHWSTSI